MALADSLVQTEVDKLIVFNPNFEKIQRYCLRRKLRTAQILVNPNQSEEICFDLTDELIASGFRQNVIGNQRSSIEENTLIRLITVLPSGRFILNNYFGPKQKPMSKTWFINDRVYRDRIKNNAWLQPETKSKAITKLDAMTIHVGYPEELPSYYDLYEVESYEEGSNLILETLKFARLTNKDNFSKYQKEPNRKIWGMPASMVNAYYNPFNNQIVFPAAILQRPYIV